MFNLKKDTIIYVVCPAFNKTGGTELAHQLVDQLVKLNIQCYITYYGNQEDEIKINPAFKKYVSEFKTIQQIEDNSDNIIIVPEINQEILNKFQYIQKSVWWMSVDNYKKINGCLNYCKYYGILKTIKNIFLGKIKLKSQKIDNNIVHFYQSEYAHQFLLNNNIDKCYKLSDYINQDYLKINELNNKRENNVLYNPKKGMKFTKKLIKYGKDLNWIPLQNMNNQEIKETLLKSKVYIDFGNHPGKDRFPREAAVLGCCVITGKKGAAAYHEDIPINDEFKFEDSNKNIEKIIKKIKDCIYNYDCEINKFEDYRKFIKNEYKIFKNDVSKITK